MTKKNKKQLEQTFLIIDEYDSLFDNKKPKKIIEQLKILQTFQNIIGFTGSSLSSEECECLQLGLNGYVIKFPKMQDDNDEQLQQRRSQIFNYQNQWIDTLLKLAKETSMKVPVIIALDKDDISKVIKFFNQNDTHLFDLTEYVRKNKFAELQTLIEKQFANEIVQGSYGIYIINSDLGRGTDFPSSNNIEENGGLYLILGDIFSARITEQIKGRVSRMQNKGQFQYLVYMKQEGNSYDYQQNRSNVIKLETQSNNEALLTLLRQNYEENQSFSVTQYKGNYPQAFFVSQTLLTEITDLNSEVFTDNNDEFTSEYENQKSFVEEESKFQNVEPVTKLTRRSERLYQKQEIQLILPQKRFSDQDPLSLEKELESQQQTDILKRTSRQESFAFHKQNKGYYPQYLSL